jgi:hypothetical protein
VPKFQKFSEKLPYLSPKQGISCKIYYAIDNVTNVYHFDRDKKEVKKGFLRWVYLWRTGYDGIVAYCFMDIKAGKKPGPVAYDDTRSYDQGIRVGEHNLMVAFPTANGTLIPTLQLEGIRDGINDLRYIETLEQLIMANIKAKRKVRETAEAEKFIQDFKKTLPTSYSSIYNQYKEKEYQLFRKNFSHWINALR